MVRGAASLELRACDRSFQCRIASPASRRGLAASIRRSPTFIGASTRSRRWSCARRQPFRPNLLSATIEAPSPVPLLSAGGRLHRSRVARRPDVRRARRRAPAARVHRIRPASRARRCRSGSARGRVVRRSGSRRRHASAERALPRSCRGGHQPALLGKPRRTSSSCRHKPARRCCH